MGMKTLFPTTLLLALLLASDLSAAGSKPKKPKVSDADQREAILLYNQGTAQLKDQKYAEAEADLKASLEKNEELAEAHNNLAFVLRKQGEDRYKESLKHYNRALRLNRKLSEAYMYRGVLYTAMGETQKAQRDLKKLEKYSPVLARELQWVIENGKEKEPAHFFGVTSALEAPSGK